MKYAITVARVNQILKEYTIKLTLRQIYYRLVAGFGLPNTKSSYNVLSSQLVKARELGHVDEKRIEDRTRGFLGGEKGWDDPEHFKDDFREYIKTAWEKQFDKELWKDQTNFVLIWVEKDALSRVISEVADKYRVIVAPSRGYASFTYVRRAVAHLPNDKEVYVLHFADHDSSGLDMTRDLKRRLVRYGATNLTVERIALTHRQVKKYDLIPNPTKITDTRAKDYIAKYGYECWELDAIEPKELQKIVLAAIEAHVDLKEWNKSKRKLEEERQIVKEALEEWTKAIALIED